MIKQKKKVETPREDFSKWNKSWPKESGHYWFYGRPYRHGEPKISLVEVRMTGIGLVYVAGGHYLYRGEGALGLWMKAKLPKLPQ